MINLERARMVADYLRAKAEVRRASLGTLIALVLVTILEAHIGDTSPWWSHVWVIAGLIIGPWLLRAIPIEGTLPLFRLELVAFPLNALLLGLILFMEANHLPKIQSDTIPALHWLFPALSLFVPVSYVFLGIADWIRRLKLITWISSILAVPPVDAYLEEPLELITEALSRPPTINDSWAQFRTVPASAKNVKLFFKLDTARHGNWRVAFSDEYALVFFEDGSQCEAVAPGAIQLAVDDAPRAGERERMILVRWNQRFHEGRILRHDLLKIQTWISRSGGFEVGTSVPAPGF